MAERRAARRRVAKRRAAPRRRRAPLAEPLPFRVGLGFDIHPFDERRRLTLGGVRLRSSPGLRGHSDADVLAHAVCDALLGALGLDDMGIRFPDTDPAHRGKSSLVFLRQVMRDARRHGYRIGNLDTVVAAEAPRLRPHLQAMRRTIARALGCDPARVSIKAKRGEGLGAIGRREGIAAQAIVLLLRAAVPGRPRR